MGEGKVSNFEGSFVTKSNYCWSVENHVLSMKISAHKSKRPVNPKYNKCRGNQTLGHYSLIAENQK